MVWGISGVVDVWCGVCIKALERNLILQRQMDSCWITQKSGRSSSATVWLSFILLFYCYVILLPFILLSFIFFIILNNSISQLSRQVELLLQVSDYLLSYHLLPCSSFILSSSILFILLNNSISQLNRQVELLLQLSYYLLCC